MTPPVCQRRIILDAKILVLEPEINVDCQYEGVDPSRDVVSTIHLIQNKEHTLFGMGRSPNPAEGFGQVEDMLGIRWRIAREPSRPHQQDRGHVQSALTI
jgi:hypothetical protein